MTIGAPPQALESKTAAGSGTIAFALVALDAAPPKRNRQGPTTRDQPAARRLGRPAANCKLVQHSNNSFQAALKIAISS
jgi:hypothetical protein